MFHPWSLKSVGFLLFIASAAMAERPPSVPPRPVKQHPAGTRVVFKRSVDYSRQRDKVLEIPQAAANLIIESANQIRMRSRPARPRPFQEAPLGSFTIGKDTWLHLLEVGVLEDPAYQGVKNASLERLAKTISKNYGNLNKQVFTRWAEREQELKRKEAAKTDR